jgi:hypothetical protein
MSEHKAGFTVDLPAVRSFGTGLRADLDGHLSLENDQILRTFLTTPSFGTQTASPDIQAAATTYHQKLIKLLDLMDTFVHNATVMAQAAQEVATAYTQADALSGAQILTTFATAKAKTEEAIWTAEHDPKTGRAA